MATKFEGCQTFACTEYATIKIGRSVYCKAHAEYVLARRVGDKRFASDCSHSKIQYGRCLNCLRSIVG